VDIND